jgi:7-cyano-7-deazaguanine reductase
MQAPYLGVGGGMVIFTDYTSELLDFTHTRANLAKIRCLRSVADTQLLWVQSKIQNPKSKIPMTQVNPPAPTAPVTELKYGERAIIEGELITFPNPRIGRRYNVAIDLPEFTCKCPFSGYPDFATIHINYVPDQKVVELKALKLYINSFRDRYISHEEVANQILDDFVAIADPHQIILTADFSPRGNVHMVVEVKHEK